MIKVTISCPYCGTGCVLHGRIHWEFATCSCKATRAVQSYEAGVEAVQAGIDMPEVYGYTKIAPPVPDAISVEEARARENVASLVNRIDGLEQQIAELQAQTAQIDDRRVGDVKLLLQRFDKTQHRIGMLETEITGPALVARLGSYLRSMHS